MQKRKRKTPVARTPADVVRFKERFLEQVAKGLSPGAAARVGKIARSTAFGWKKDDPEFAEKWTDAVESGLDKLENSLYESALAGNSSAAQFILKHRRRDVYGSTERRAQSNNFFRQSTLAEHYKRLERLGLPVPTKAVKAGE
jgi:hypothetical protein